MASSQSEQTLPATSKLKHLWIINHYAVGPGDSGGTRHHSLAKYLKENGWDTTIIAASFSHCNGAQFLKKEKRKVDTDGGVRFLRISTPEYAGNGLGRITNMLSFSLRAVMPGYTREIPSPDIVIGSSVHPFAAASGAILSRRFRVPFIFEVRDLWPETLVAMGRLKAGSPLTRFLRFLEKRLYSSAKVIIVLLPKADAYISKLGPYRDKVVWIPNGVDIPGVAVPEPPREKSRFTLMYIGAHGEANGLDVLLEAMHILDRRKLPKPLELKMIGAGERKEELKQQARELGLGNVRFCQAIPKKMVPATAAEADAFVVTVRNMPGLYRYGISMNKIYDYMAAGRPTVIAVDSANNPIQEADAGVTVPPDDPSALADGIERMMKMSHQELTLMGSRARSFVEQNNSFETLAKQLTAVLNRACAD